MDAIDRQDIHEVAWSLLREVVSGSAGNLPAALISTLVRAIVTLGPAPASREQALREAELRGLLMYGLTPRTPEEWELAESIFDDSAMAELHRRDALPKPEP